jgi:hypothetical protein
MEMRVPNQMLEKIYGKYFKKFACMLLGYSEPHLRKATKLHVTVKDASLETSFHCNRFS